MTWVAMFTCSALLLVTIWSLLTPAIGMGKIDPSGLHHWVWFPKAKSNKISNAVYHFLNSTHLQDELRFDWKNIWHLNASPRVKTFIRMLCHGKIKTSK